MRHRFRLIVVLGLAGCVQVCANATAGETDAAEAAATEKVFNSRPNFDTRQGFGHIGPTGIDAYIYKNLEVTVEDVAAGSPAAGKFNKGDIITGVNGTALRGRNPYVVLGKAITEAEATDGKLVFDVRRGKLETQAMVTIPVLGTYSDTWPADCSKSKKIVEQAAAFYHQRLKQRQADGDSAIPGTGDENRGIPGALMCLFLLSTGDDEHLPVVKDYFAPFIANPEGIGDHTWNNGYNGIACAEYYLRTGDKEVLPVLQYYCDNAEQRQKFGVGWPHWGRDINPRYVAGGLMNPASAQVFTTLLLAKECGVDVDDQTLLGSLKFFYRFVGHGTVPYGDHRSEGGLGSNGKDGMVAAAMQVASGANGDTSIYESARDYLSMSTLKSYPTLVTGHGDGGRGDGIWRGISAIYLEDKKPDEYRAMMNRLKWWFDLSRFHNGAMGMATADSFNDVGSGAAVAISYTAHLKNLRILGAPPSKYAVDFTLPEHLWGRPADRVFHGIEHLPEFAEYGEEEEPHRLLKLLGNAYKRSAVDSSRKVSKQVKQNVYHHRYMFRSQAAKALRKNGEFDFIEQLLNHGDPRMRRAALDGILDWRYWFGIGKNPLQTDQYTPGMIEAITNMIADPDEAWYVVEGALLAMHHMPAEVIHKHLDQIMPWTTHEEWWIRHGAFMALQGLAKDDERYLQVLPTLIKMMIDEYRTMPRQKMMGALKATLKKRGVDSPAGKMILAGFKQATAESEIKLGLRSREGSYNVIQSVKRAIAFEPGAAITAAVLLRDRFDKLDTARLLEVIARSGNAQDGFYPILNELHAGDRQALADILYEDYLPELQERLKTEGGTNLALIDTVLALKRLKKEVTGWQVLGSPPPAERTWRFVSIDPTTKAEKMRRQNRKRFRDITLPDSLESWYKPGFDASDWHSGHAPIGKGEIKKDGEEYRIRSPWGKGEFLLARTTFELDALDYDLYRLNIFHNQGFRIYLNGEPVSTYVWWSNPRHWKRNLTAKQAGLLKKGTNTLAVYANVEYPSEMKPHRWDQKELGRIDCWIEALRKRDLY